MKKKKWQLAVASVMAIALISGTKAFRCNQNLGLSGRDI